MKFAVITINLSSFKLVKALHPSRKAADSIGRYSVTILANAPCQVLKVMSEFFTKPIGKIKASYMHRTKKYAKVGNYYSRNASISFIYSSANVFINSIIISRTAK